MTKIFGSLLSLIVLGLFIGCTDPTSNREEPPPPVRDSQPLDRNANVIAPGEKPYLIDSDWVIEAGRSVTIQPGTEFVFNGLFWVDVQGQLIAEGSPDAPIIFTTAFINKDFGQWRGFKIRSETDTSYFRHCIFSYGAYFDIDTLSDRGQDAQRYRGMLSAINSSPVIEHCVIFHNQNNGVFISGANARPRVRFNVIAENDASAVRADTMVNLDEINVTYNNVSDDNSAIAFLMGYDSTRFGVRTQVNANLDSCDQFFNIELPPLFVNAPLGDFHVNSCSPNIDAGPVSGEPNDPDGTRPDFGVYSKFQAPGELRGVLGETEVELTSAQSYTLKCHLKVNFGQTITIQAGTRITVEDYYEIQVFGRILAMGTRENPITITGEIDSLWSRMTLFEVDSLQRRPAPWTYPSEFHYVDFINFDGIDVMKPGVIFEGCTFQGGFSHGVNVNLPSKQLQDTVSFRYCDFADCGSYAIHLVESPAAIRNCEIQRCQGRGISATRGGDKIFISNTIVQSCNTSGIVADSGAHLSIINSVVRNCGYYGMQFTNQCRPTVMNSIVTDCARYGLYAFASSIPDMNYNCFFNNSTLGSGDNFNAHELPPGTIDSLNLILTNPLFAGLADAHLTAGSPCIDTGNPDAAFNDVVDDTRNDLGAYGGPFGDRVGRVAFPRNKSHLAAR